MFVANVNEAWKFWSLRLGAIGTALASLFLASPESAMLVWSMFPDEFKQFIPPHWMPFIGIFLFLCGMVARVIDQKSVVQKG